MPPRTPILAVLLLAMSAQSSAAIPAFARKYRTTCLVCHAPVPRLNDLGERFAANGFEFAPGEQPRDTIQTGDPLLRLQRELPLAIRVDGYVRALTRVSPDESRVDLQVPWVMKLLSGGQIADKVSYYTYFLLSERGEVAGLEDAYVQFTDVWSSGVTLVLGQFQVSDPLLKRELRLHYEDYQPYRVRVGDARPDLTYERGMMALWSPRRGTDFSAQLVNGEGLRPATGQRQFDSDGLKNLALHLSQDFGPVTLGGFGYFGQERSAVRNRITVWGPNATVALGTRGELNLQFLRRTDTDPFFGACTPAEPCPGGATAPFATTADAFMAEILVWPRGPAGRWFITGLVNAIAADAPVISLRLGEQESEPGFLRRYTTSTFGLHHVVRRNLRLMSEATWDFERDRARLVTGLSAAF